MGRDLQLWNALGLIDVDEGPVALVRVKGVSRRRLDRRAYVPAQC